MRLDGGEGKYYAESFPDNRFQLLSIEGKKLFGAASVTFNTYSPDVYVEAALEDSCLMDVRFDLKWFPMDQTEDSESDIAYVASSQNMEDQCLSEACVGVDCPVDMICFDRWKMPHCM